jgi:hypothetical protein
MSILTSRAWIVALLLDLLLAGVSQAADLYVKPGGSGNACTLGNECSWGTGIGQLKAGGTLYLRGGTYPHPGVTTLPCGTAEDKRVTIRNYQQEVAILSQTSTSDRPVIVAGNNECGYITMEGSYNKATDQRGIVLHGIRFSFGDYTSGNEVGDPVGHHITLRHVEIRATNSHMITHGGHHNHLDNAYIHDNVGSHCIYVHWSDSIIENSKFQGCKGFGIHWRNSKGDSGKCQPNCGVERNIIRNTIVSGAGVGRAGGAGIQMAYGGMNQVYNNLVYDNMEYGISVTSGNSKVWNNTVVNNNLSGLPSQGGLRVNTTSLEVVNNIVVGNRSKQIFTTNGTSLTGSNIHHNLTSGDLRFVNPNVDDFHLKTGSPAINAGVTSSAFKTDKDGSTRPVGAAWDIGAYEFGGQAPAPGPGPDPGPGPGPDPGPGPGDTTPPSVPLGLTATLESTTEVMLEWEKSTGDPVRYPIRQCQMLTGQPECIPETVIARSSDTAHQASGLNPASTYVWAVSAVDAAGNESEPGEPVLVVMAGEPPEPPTGDYNPPVMEKGVQGDGVGVVQNTLLTITMRGPVGPDPAICAELDAWFLAYEQQRQPIAACVLQGTALRLTVAQPPAAVNTSLALTFLPTGQQLALSNHIVR